jgi:hypothetical protein
VRTFPLAFGFPFPALQVPIKQPQQGEVVGPAGTEDGIWKKVYRGDKVEQPE